MNVSGLIVVLRSRGAHSSIQEHKHVDGIYIKTHSNTCMQFSVNRCGIHTRIMLPRLVLVSCSRTGATNGR